ncbi:MAG: hypothetical protein Q9191_004626 [Dirinaria sp. TL-2023a]
MAEPTSVEVVFNQIRQVSRQALGRGYFEYFEFVEKEIQKATKRYPFMSGVTRKDFSLHFARKDTEKKQAQLTQPKPTSEQFWDAAYKIDPLHAPADHVSDLQKIMTMRNLENVPLGKYGGMEDAVFELMPALGSLPRTEDAQELTSLPYASTDSGAITYPDGRPSEYEDAAWRIKSRDDHTLRRFASLGWVVRVQRGSWKRTGHVLVMDMDAGRNRHPWFVLASHWPSESEDEDGGFTTYADKEVARDDAHQPGVFPGETNRTPVAKIVPYGESDERPILKQFGPNFNFLAVRCGGERSQDKTIFPRGPDLAHVMDWYWDPKTEEEVCFYKNGKVYLKYDRKTERYTYGNKEDTLSHRW